MTIAIQYPAALYVYGPFPSVPGMSRPRTLYAARRAPACPVIIAETPDAARKMDAALNDCANAARVNSAAPPAVWIDAAQWLTNREIRHAAAMAGCRVVDPAQCQADGCDAPAMDTGDLCHDCQADVMPRMWAPADMAREAAEARWRFHDAEDTLDLY